MSNDNIRLPDGSNDWVLSSDDGKTIVVYRKDNNGGGIIMDGLSGRYSINWYNPREGGLLQEGTVTTIIAGDINPVFYGDSPDLSDKDWVVLIQSI
jgi:hypothetical protein